MRCKVLIALLAILVQPLALAETTLEEKFIYYEVSGNSAQQLRASINRERFARGKRFDALTSWVIRWHFTYEPQPAKCRITNVTIDTDIEYLMPRWLDADSHPNRQLAEHWNRYARELTTHELYHGALVRQTTLEIERAIYATDDIANAPSDCKVLEQLAHARANQLMEDLNRRQIAFDVETDHGRGTGARFP